MPSKLPPEILQKILAATEDILPKAILGLPPTRNELVEFGGPGRVMDNFLTRGVDDRVTLSILVPYVPVECAITKGVTRMDEELVERIARVWGVDGHKEGPGGIQNQQVGPGSSHGKKQSSTHPIISTQGHILSMQLGWRWGVEHVEAAGEVPDHRTLLQEYYVKSGQWEEIDWDRARWLDASVLSMLPVDKRPLLGELKSLVLDICECPRERLNELVDEYKGVVKLKGSMYPTCPLIGPLIGYASPERVVDFAHLIGLDEFVIKQTFFVERYMDGLRALGTLSADELDAYEMLMDPDETIIDYTNDNVYTISWEILCDQGNDYGPPWYQPGCELQPENYSEEVLLGKVSQWLKSGEMKGVMRNDVTSMLGYRYWDEIWFPHPKTFIGDQKGTNAILLAWCWCGCPGVRTDDMF